MSRLFLIGNGYDLCRRGDTSYKHFKEWLEEHYLNKYKDIFVNEKRDINYKIFYDKKYAPSALLKNVLCQNEKQREKLNKMIQYSIEYEKKITLAILFNSMNLINDKDWNNFEEDLSKLPLENQIDNYQKFNKKSSIKLESSLGSPVNKETETICSIRIEDLFAEWINKLSDKQIIRQEFEDQIIKDIQNDDTFIIFNYTYTIENLFNNYDKSIFYHIHGTKDNKNSITVGHNCKEKSKPSLLANKSDFINELYSSLYKNPEHVIKENTRLWERISKQTNLDIYEYGWSCSSVDSDYIKKIVSIINDNNIKVKIHFNNFGNHGIDKFMMWKKCGLKSSFKCYCYNENNIKEEKECKF